MKKYITQVYLNVVLKQTGHLRVLKRLSWWLRVGLKYCFGPPIHPIYRKNVLKCTRVVYFLTLNRMVQFFWSICRNEKDMGNFAPLRVVRDGSRTPRKIENRL